MMQRNKSMIIIAFIQLLFKKEWYLGSGVVFVRPEKEKDRVRGPESLYNSFMSSGPA